MKKSNIFKSSLIYFISCVLFLVLKLLSSYNLFDFLGENGNLYVNMFIQIGIMFLIPLCLYMCFYKTGPKKVFQNIQFSKVRISTIGLSFIAGFIMFICVVLISAIMSKVLSVIGYKNPFVSSASTEGGNFWQEFLIPVLTSAMLPAFCEEFLNRGILLNGLNELSPKKAIIFSAVLFGLLHYNINQVVYAILVGIVFGTITHFSKSILPAMIMHFTNNFCSVYFSYASQNGIFGKNFYSYLDLVFQGPAILVFIQTLLALAVFGMLLYYLVIGIYKSTQTNRMGANLQEIAQKYLGDYKSTKKGKMFEVDENKQFSQDELFIKMKEEVVNNIKSENDGTSYFKKFVPDKKIKKCLLFEKVFLYASICLALTVTVFTFIWGIL